MSYQKSPWEGSPVPAPILVSASPYTALSSSVQTGPRHIKYCTVEGCRKERKINKRTGLYINGFCRECDKTQSLARSLTQRAEITRPGGELVEVSRLSGSVAKARREGWPIRYFNRNGDGHSITATTRRRNHQPLHKELDRIRDERKKLYEAADKKDAAKKDGFVYVILNPAKPDRVKIGHSRDPWTRLSEALTWDDQRAFILCDYVFFEQRERAETAVHSKLAHHRIRGVDGKLGEWFRISPDHAISIINELSWET